jgi:hypothetical protein
MCAQFQHICCVSACWLRVHGRIVGWGTMLHARRSHIQFPLRLLKFCSWHNPFSCTAALGSTHPLTEISTRNHLVPKIDSLTTTTCEPIVKKMWEPWCLTNLWAYTICCLDRVLLPAGFQIVLCKTLLLFFWYLDYVTHVQWPPIQNWVKYTAVVELWDDTPTKSLLKTVWLILNVRCTSDYF